MIYRFQTDPRLSNGTVAPTTQKQVIDQNTQNLDLTVQANKFAFLDSIHALMSLVEGGGPDILLTNRQGRLAFGQAARGAQLMKTTQDAFGRMVETFGDGGPVIIDAGVTPAGAFDRSVQVIPTSTAGNDFTDAIFAIKFGSQESGALQKKAMETIDFREDASTFPFLVANVEWAYGFQITNPLSVAVLRRGF